MPKMFLYSQDLSNCTTGGDALRKLTKFLYSQDLSNCTTFCLREIENF